MPPQIHTLAPLPDASVCTEVFTYVVVVFFLVRLSIDELGPEARRRGCIPPSSILYLACILFWPVTVGIFTCLLTLGLIHAGLDKVYTLVARGAEACRRRITIYFPNRRRVEDLEMGPFVPCRLEGLSSDEFQAEFGCSEAKRGFREVVAALKEECGMTADRWGRSVTLPELGTAPMSRNMDGVLIVQNF